MQPPTNESQQVAMVIDDDPVFRITMRVALEQEGFALVEAASGAEALELMLDVSPDIILLDIMMPGMNGYDVFDAIRSMPETKDIPVIMLTGLDDEDSIKRAYTLGATDFLTKPVNYLILIHRVKYILQANRFLVNFDSVTSLPNRKVFLEHLSMSMRAATRTETFLAVLFIDIDNFRRINHGQGYGAGDRLLRVVADRLRHSVRESDTLGVDDDQKSTGYVGLGGSTPLARLSGNAFVMTLSSFSDMNDIIAVVERIQDSIRLPVVLDSETLYLTASIGLSVFPLHHEDSQELLSQSESAMQSAKTRGGNQFILFDDNLERTSNRKLSIEARLRTALANDGLQLFYQPKLTTGEYDVVGVEALARWTDDELGFVSPGEFIPVAEQTGLIHELSDWVVQKACSDLRIINDSGFEQIKMAVNLSAAQFSSDSMVYRISDAIENAGIDPWKLDVEITEGLLMNDTNYTVRCLCELRELGLGLHIDDFGTGYSSLAYLKDFPVTGLKIDQSFIRDILVDRDDAAIVKTIIYLGDALNAQVIAEGVENSGQLKFLEQNNCDVVQGYYFTPALALEDLFTWVQARMSENAKATA